MGVQAAVKRCMDVVGAAVLVVLTSPLWLGVAVAIRRDSPGPVLFRQTRIGRNGRPFVILKFRTMRVGAEREWRPPTSDEFHDYVFQDAGDLRITSVGNFLRRTSLDELPQLMNVLKGDMSLVGPRPEIPEMVALYSPEMHRRHRMRPGMTGLAQVSGRGELSTGETMAYDLHYCDHWSLAMDFSILWRTILQVLRAQGAR